MLLHVFSKLGLSLDSLSKFMSIAFIRTLVGFAQFSILIFLVAELPLGDVGKYTIFSIFVSYGTLLLGFNFHTFVARELVHYERQSWSHLLNQNLQFLLINSLLTFPFLFFLFQLNVLPKENAIFFLTILALSATNNQIENFLIASGNPLTSTFNVFLRSIWILPLFLISKFHYIKIEIINVFQVWLIFEAIGLIYALIMLKNLSFISFAMQNINVRWIRKGLAIGFKYTLLGLMLLMTFTIQRLVLAQTYTEEHVGIFQFFFSIAVFFPNLVEASVFSIVLPKIIRESLSPAGNILELPNFKLFFGLLIGIGSGLVIIYLLLPTALTILNKPQLIIHQHLFAYISIYSILYFISRFFHYHLYAANKDKSLSILNTIALLTSFFSSLLLIPKLGLIGAAISLVITGLVMATTFGYPFFRKMHGQLKNKEH